MRDVPSVRYDEDETRGKCVAARQPTGEDLLSLLHSDVVVIGSELSGWVAGALLAQTGRRVTVIDDEEGVDMRPLGERNVPLCPTLWRMPQTGPAAQVIDQLGLRQRARAEFARPVGLGLVDDPEIRMVLGVEPEARQHEVQRVFGTTADIVLEGLARFRIDARDCLVEEATRLHENGFFSRLRAKQRRKSYGTAGQPQIDDNDVRCLLSTPLGIALKYVAPFVQNLSNPAPNGVASWLAAWQLVAGTLAGTKSGIGLRGAFRRMLTETIEANGGEVIEEVRIRHVETDGKKATQIKTSGADDYACKCLIDATRSRTLAARMTPSPRRETYLAEQEQVPLTRGAAIVRWLLPAGLQPRGMPERLVVLPEEIEGAPALVGVFPAPPLLDRPKQNDTAQVAVVAVAPCAIDDSDAQCEKLDHRLQRLMPYVKSGVVAQDHIFGMDAASILPGYGQSPTNHFLAGRSPATAFSNVARAGRDLAPALGIEVEIASARAVAQYVESRLGRPPQR